MALPVLLIGLSIVGACGSDDESEKSSDDTSSTTQSDSGAASGDEGYSTEVKKCAVDEKTGFLVHTDTEITNETDETHDYIVHIAITDPGGTKLGESHSTTDDVAAGESATTDGVAQSTDEMRNVDLTCEVYDVTVG